MEEIHRQIAYVVGELSLAIVRRTAKRIQYLNWAGILREQAKKLEERANAGQVPRSVE